jgi:hypothetical protein
MKQLFLIFVFLFASASTYGQPGINQPKKPGVYLPDGTKVDEYKKTFEVKDNPDPNKEELCKVDASKYWKYIQENQRTEVYDEVTGFTLILYSRNEIAERMGNTDELLYVMPSGDNRGESKSQE